ncbi:MAG TPA: ABC transporter ATP-binding protein [Mycobacteriales bacterium]|nr:ABC transporter ATP-binding protein [Mycobacteriales bacterium]
MTDEAPVISAYDVSKRFVTKRRETSLKESAVRRGLRRGPRIEKDDFWALRGISLEIGRGQTVGLIGHNGSGKSTLLKTLAGILQPDSGSAHIIGRVASLLELGAGFNAELSGRDNVYLNAALLGLSRQETDDLFDSIVEFSELGDRIDDPVKVYSSGMYVKLGFAVAVHVDPDVLLIDEVLAVGDEAFQEKCLARIKGFQEAGKTILFVSHALDIVRSLCDRAIVLDHGRMVYDGDSDHAVRLLRGLLGVAELPETMAEAIKAEVVPLAIEDIEVAATPGGERLYAFGQGDPLAIRVHLDVQMDEQVWGGGDVTVVVMTGESTPLWVMSGGGEAHVRPEVGPWIVDFVVPVMPPVRGPFTVAVSVRDSASDRVLVARQFENALAAPGDIAEGWVYVPYEASVAQGIRT